MGIKVKKSTAILAVTAAAGFTALSATPATAVGLPFNNCTEAAAAGVFNIPAASPAYQPKLDADMDGFGCDAAGTPAFNQAIVDRIIAENNPQPMPNQMNQMPVGGVDTGVAQEPAKDATSTLVLGSGLVLAAAAGGTYLVRRRSTDHA
ncbi:excalibur calcium-binding domain-containing protein [uncultured Arthrobacter sp.]|uniref:excalibur calcium-binding domain-containing protein n=1 Tax=uncultured Arthrobacter sp. TaxID=114050 RepID=UPI0025E9ADAD|nr:excalibur calcium-binding domain-containing protein [uncultured Arthrobacter sp.]